MTIRHICSYIGFVQFLILSFDFLNFKRIDELLLRLQLFVVFEISVQRQC